ncbi:hypothetical protein COP2_003856 [Malus domestica]
MPSFTNLRPKIECLTDRRFTISHLAQLKFVLPKVIEITKVLVKDRITNNMKSDLRVTMNVDAVENDNKSKYDGGGHMHLRRAFRHQLGEISKSQPEVMRLQMKHILTPSEQSKEDLNSNISGIPDPSLPTETSCEALIADTSNNNSSSLIFSKTLFSTSLPRSKCFSSRVKSQYNLLD